MKIKKTFTISLILSLIVVAITSATIFILGYITQVTIPPKTIGIVLLIVFLLLLYISQKLVKVYIKLRIDNIYDQLPDLKRKKVNPIFQRDEFDLLSRNVSKHIDSRKREIKKLNSRENYRRDFLGNVAHELKTPLFTVQGYLLTLIEGAAENPEIREKYLNRASSAIDRLNEIVTDLDLITKLETNDLKLKIETFNIIRLVQKVFDLLEMQAKKRNIKLTFDKFYDFPEFVSADKAKIEQVLINLVMNSIKYGKNDGTTIVSFKYLNEEKLQINVSDNGEGIGEENLPRLFERFYRVDKSRSRDQGGSGLGLSIVKHILEAHENVIDVTSRVGYGSTFFFTLDKD